MEMIALFMFAAVAVAGLLAMAAWAAAAGTIDTSYLLLFDNWPGVPQAESKPFDNFITTEGGHNVAAVPSSQYLGKKVQIYDSINKGMATLMYLQAGTADAGAAFAAAQICTIAGPTDNAAFVYYQVNNTDSDTLLAVASPLCAVMISAMTTDYYGWFWVGGVCPEKTIPALATTVATKLEATAGAIRQAVGVGDLGTYLGLVPFEYNGAAAALDDIGGACGVVLTSQTDD